jgi:hypothetical protein
MDARIGPFKDIPGEKMQMLRTVRIEIRGVVIPTDDRDESLLADPVQSGAEGQVKRHGKNIMSDQSIKVFQGTE